MKRRIAASLICSLIILCFIVASISITPQSKAATITVDDDGPADYHSIQLAILAASAGDTVYVHSGIYNEHLVIDKTINLTGEDRDTTIIDGQGVGDVVYISANWVNMSGFTVRDSGPNGNPRDAGIEVNNAHHVTVSDNMFSSNRDAIYLYNSNDSLVADNTVDDFEGIHIANSRNITISGNVISTQYYGIYLDSSVTCKISNNVMTNTGFELGGSTEHWSTHDIDISNTVNGDPVYYWKNQNAGAVPTGAGQVILANCTNVNVENQHISDTYIGIILGYSNNNLITSNNLSSTEEYGLSLFSSEENSISGNTFWDNDIGIRFFFSDGNNISNNVFSDNLVGIEFGFAGNNTISGNTIADNTYGLMLIFSNENKISKNNIERNWVGHGVSILESSENIFIENTLLDNTYGFFLNNSHKNKIYHNNITSNFHQAIDDTDSGNQWDNGYPSGGNYWDDYSGADTKNGPNQDVSGPDGIGDTPYELDTDSLDRYPLIEPFGVDTTPPEIELSDPFNNTVTLPGIIINLTISDKNLREVTYSINGGPYQTLASPYDIETEGWEDDDYRIDVKAKDTSDNTNTASYNIIIDTTSPVISLSSPPNGSYVDASPEIDITISDANLEEVYYSVNSGTQLLLSPPYVIDGTGWPEGDNILTVQAVDKAGNFNENWFVFTKDSLAPEIALNTPANGSFLLEPTTLDFEVSDANIRYIIYRINQGSYADFEEPYDLDTTGWDDGEHRITIQVDDEAGNLIERWFVFTIDASIPEIESASKVINGVNAGLGSRITIKFSESMDTDSVESAISVDPYTEYTCTWEDDNKTMILEIQTQLEYETLYTVSIGPGASDMSGHGLESTYEMEFTTEAEPEGGNGGDKGDDFPLLYLLLVIISAIAVAIIVSAVVISKRKKGSKVSVSIPSEVAGQIQVTCSSCGNLLSVNDIGTTMNVSCPFCSQVLTIQSQMVAAQMSQPQTPAEILPPSMQISCPQCQFVFSVEKTGGPTKVQCPNCGVSGTMNT